MKRNKRQSKVMLLVIILLCLTIGFALISTTLKINGTVSIKDNTWDIHWDSNSISVKRGSVAASTPTVSTTSSTNDTVTFGAVLDLPGDYYEFTIDAVNAGSVDGALSTVSVLVFDGTGETELTGDDIPDYLKFTITYDDGTIPHDGDILYYGDNQTYKIRVEYDDSDDFVEEVESYQLKVMIPYIQHKTENNSLITIPEGKTKNNLEVGDEICIRNECFNFIRYDGKDIVMLAKYNLKVGYIIESENFTRVGEYTSNDEGYGLQSSEARGWVSGDPLYKGIAPFSTTNYWDNNGTPKSDYPGTYFPQTNYPTIYDATNYKGAPGTQTYSVAYYVDAYKTVLTEYGATIKDARLLTYVEATDSSIGCSQNIWDCPNNHFIKNTSFWLGSAYTSDMVWHIGTGTGSFVSYTYNDPNIDVGVRPVIVINKNIIN